MPDRAKVGNFLRKKREGNLGIEGKGNESQKGRGFTPDDGVADADTSGQDTAPVRALPNVIEVVRYLADLGWKVSKSPVYRHRDQGHLRPQPDGSFLTVDVLKFARKYLKRRDGGPGSGGDEVDEMVGVAAEKAAAEAKKAKAQAEHWHIKTKIMRRQYVERAKFESALAARALIFRTDWENFFRSRAGEIVGIVEGNAQLIPELIDYMLENLEDILNRYSEENREFKVEKIDADSDSSDI